MRRAVSVDRCLWLSGIAQSGAEPDVVVGIRPGVVQVRVEHARIRAVVPVAAAIRETL